MDCFTDKKYLSIDIFYPNMHLKSIVTDKKYQNCLSASDSASLDSVSGRHQFRCWSLDGRNCDGSPGCRAVGSHLYIAGEPLFTGEQFHRYTEGLQVEEADCLEAGFIFVG
jgi:hypothetical protein